MFHQELSTSCIPNIFVLDSPSLNHRIKCTKRMRNYLGNRFLNEYFGQLYQLTQNKETFKQFRMVRIVLLKNECGRRDHLPLVKVVQLLLFKDAITRLAYK